jgi:tetratricopeptide (TPR) repeat protein
MKMTPHWLISIVVFPIVLITVDGCFQESAETKTARHREQALAYFDKGEYDKALIEFKNVLKLNSTDPDAHYHTGLIYLKRGTMQDLQQAFKEFSATVELDPTNQDAQLKLGQLLLLAGQPEKARSHADIVLATAPDNKDGVALRGTSLLREEKFEDAVTELKKAIALDPQNINNYLELARAYIRLKDYGFTEFTLQEGLRVHPHSLELRFALGDLHLMREKPDLAEAEYKRALNDAPDQPEPHLKLGYFYVSTNRLTEAEATYLAWAKARPQDETPFVTLGGLYQFTGHLKQAIENYQKALVLNPKSTTARNPLIPLLIDARQFDEAEKQTRVILEANSNDPKGRLFDGYLKLARGDIDKAIAVLQPLSREDARSPKVHQFLGMAYAKNNDLAQAIQELSEAVKLDPNSYEPRTALAAAYFNQGSEDLAIEQAQAAIRLNPQSVQAATLLGESYFRKGDLLKGKQAFEAIVKVEPGHPLAHYRLGLIAHAKKNDTDALGHFEQALKSNPRFIEPLAQIAAIKVSQGTQTEARDRLLRHRDLTPKNPQVYNLMGQFFAATKQFDEAEAAFKHAIELDGAGLEPYTGLAALYLRTNKVEAAIHEYETSLSKDPKLIPSMMVLGMIHEAQGEPDKAEARYQEALRVNHRFAPAANNLAWLMIERGGNSDIALGYASTAREVMPNDPSIADTLGWIYYQKAIYLKALPLLQEAAEKMPDNPVVLYHYGMAQYKTDNKTGAQKTLTQSLHLSPTHQKAEDAKATLAALASAK